MINWTPENKKKAWITRKVNSLLRKGATDEIASRDAEEEFKNSKMMEKWEEGEKLKAGDLEKTKSEKVLALMLEKNISKESAIERIESDDAAAEDAENNFIDEEPLLDIEGITIRHDGRQYILSSHNKNYNTYYVDLKDCLKSLLKREFGFNLGKKSIENVLEFVNELNRAEEKINHVAEMLDKKMEKILNDSILQR